MSISLSDAAAIRNMVSKDPALCEDLRRTSSRQAFLSTLTAAAQADGIIIDAATLDKSLDLVFAQTADSGELSDEQLQGVTGGFASHGTRERQRNTRGFGDTNMRRFRFSDSDNSS